MSCGKKVPVATTTTELPTTKKKGREGAEKKESSHTHANEGLSVIHQTHAKNSIILGRTVVEI